MGAKKTSEDVIKVSLKRNLKCHNPHEYSGQRNNNLEFSCLSCNSTWTTSYIMMRTGKGCLNCYYKESRVRKTKREELNKFAKDNNLKLLNPEDYTGIRCNLNWKCLTCDKVLNIAYVNLRKRKKSCCSREVKFSKSNKNCIDIIKKIEKSLKIKCLSDKYKNILLKDKLLWKCLSCDESFEKSTSNLKDRSLSGCYSCAREIQTEKNKMGEEKILELTSGVCQWVNRGDYVHSAIRNLKFKCLSCRKLFTLSYDKLKIDRGCPHCSEIEQREMKYQEEFFARLKLFLKSLGIKFRIKKEYNTKTHGRIDIVFWVKDKIFPIELKHDSSLWSQSKINNQLQKYKKYFLNQKGCDKVYLVSPRGRYGQSEPNFFEELKRLL